MSLTDHTWGSYEKSKTDREDLPPLVIGGETFIFPAQPPAEFGVELLKLLKVHGKQIPDEVAVGLIPDLIGKERADRLVALTSFQELMGIVEDLLRAYGFVEKAAAENPTQGVEGTTPATMSPETSLSGSAR